MRVALISMDQVWESKAENLAQCERYIKLAGERQADLVIFPEMTLTGYSMNTEAIQEEFQDSWSLQNFRELSEKYKISIISGVVLKGEGRPANAALFVQPERDITTYAKIHPFSFAGEDRYYRNGDELAVCRLGDCAIGMTICYDLRFPELYAILAKESDVIVNIANWPAKRIDHWFTLLKARAIEQQLYVIGVNRTGVDGNGHQYVRSSVIYNANGEKVEPVFSSEEMDLYEIDIKWTEQFRQNFNSIQDRRVAFYKELY